MKRTSTLFALAALLVGAVSVPSFAADKESKKEVTLTGEGMCAKCSLHQADKCQNVVQVLESGKTNLYFLAPNKVSKEFHENLCKENQKVTVTGKVHEENGKQVVTASKIDLAKQ